MADVFTFLSEPWISTAIAVLSAAASLVIIPLYRHVKKIRTNELEHIAADVIETKEIVKGLVKKLDDHIDWHLKTK